MRSCSAVKLMLALTLGLPLLQAVLMWVGGLLTAMGDPTTSTVLGHINTATGIAWLVSVVGLVVALALQSLDEPHDPGV
jgi:hypothetical protein